MKRVLITGANGLLGQKLVKLFIEKSNIELIATAIGDNRLPFSEGYKYYTMDVTDKQAVLNTITHAQPNIVIHGAAMTDADNCEIQKDACWRQNVYALNYIIEACQIANAFLIHISTDFVFDGVSGPYDETAQVNPISFYGWSKQASESAVQNSGLQWAIVRTMLIYGVGHKINRNNIVTWVKKSLEDGKYIKVVTDQWRSPTLAEDLAIGCYLIADKHAKGVFHISGEEIMTPYDIAVKTATYFNLDTSLIIQADASTFTQLGRRPPRTGFILDKARNILGYNPHTFEQGIDIIAGQLKGYID